MKKALPLILVLVIASSAMAITDLSLGVYGGLNSPIVQQDTKSGTGFGLKGTFAPTPMIAASVFFESRKYGSPEKTIRGITMKTDGGKVSVFGLEAQIGSVGGAMGPHFYWAVGVGSYKWKRDGYSDLSKVAYHLGPGLEINLPMHIGIEAKGKFEIVPTGGGGSRKNFLIFVGANYHIGLM